MMLSKNRNPVWSLMLLLLCAAMLMLMTTTVVLAVEADQHDDCSNWAEQGECEANPDYMLTHCATSCKQSAQQQAAAAAAIEQELASISSFYDLSAPDIDGKMINFDVFRGKVTIITNVASYCGYTASHYKGLVELWSNMSKLAPGQVEILAFPCNQFGKQEPGMAREIKEFAAEQGVEFRMMQKINVNGPQADKVYKFLKFKTDIDAPQNIKWNFATYFVVDPKGDVQVFNGVEPLQLQELALNLLNDEL